METKIGCLRLGRDGGYWTSSILALKLLAKLGVGVSHVRVDNNGEDAEDSEGCCDELLKAVYKVLAHDGTIDVEDDHEEFSYEDWYWMNNQLLVDPRPFPLLFFNGRATELRCSDADSDDDDDLVEMLLEASVSALPVVEQHAVLRYPAAARVIQRAFRRLEARKRAARTLQRAWRRVSGDPYGKLGKRLLRARFLPPIDAKRRRLE